MNNPFGKTFIYNRKRHYFQTQQKKRVGSIICPTFKKASDVIIRNERKGFRKRIHFSLLK
jgi:hypothetical protein